MNLAPNRGRGECRVPVAPAASCAVKKAHELVTTVAPEHPAFPHAMVLTAYFVLSPVIGLSCHRRPADMVLSAPGRADLASAGLDAGVEASGPHDFTVRESAVRQRAVDRSRAETRPAIPSRALALPRPPHPVPYVRDDRETPLCVGRDGKGYRFDLGRAGTGIFLQMGLDSRITKQPVGQISRPARLSQKSEGGRSDPPLYRPRTADYALTIRPTVL
jgi:hypothetical protein